MGDAFEWVNAGCALLTGKDPKPLASLLRDGQPIPNEIRCLLATLLDPPKIDPYGCRLKLVDTNDIVKNFEEKAGMSGEYESIYNTKMKNGENEPSQAAAREAAKNFYVSDRTIYRAKKHLDDLRTWLRKRD